MSIVDPAGTRTFLYDAEGQLRSSTDRTGATTSFGYDALGRRTNIMLPDPDGSGPLAAPVTTFFYDTVGNLVRQADPLNHVTRWVHDNPAVGRFLSEDPIVAQPCCRKPDTIIEKLMKFHEEHATPMAQLLPDLDAAAAQIPGTARTREAQPLAQRLDRIDQRRGPGPDGNRSSPLFWRPQSFPIFT